MAMSAPATPLYRRGERRERQPVGQLDARGAEYHLLLLMSRGEGVVAGEYVEVAPGGSRQVQVGVEMLLREVEGDEVVGVESPVLVADYGVERCEAQGHCGVGL